MMYVMCPQIQKFSERVGAMSFTKSVFFMPLLHA